MPKKYYVSTVKTSSRPRYNATQRQLDITNHFLAFAEKEAQEEGDKIPTLSEMSRLYLDTFEQMFMQAAQKMVYFYPDLTYVEALYLLWKQVGRNLNQYGQMALNELLEQDGLISRQPQAQNQVQYVEQNHKKDNPEINPVGNPEDNLEEDLEEVTVFGYENLDDIDID